MIVDPIDEDQVFERLVPVLEARGLLLRRGSLDGMASGPLGRFYTTRRGSEEVVDHDLDLQRCARELGALGANEAMVPAHGQAPR